MAIIPPIKQASKLEKFINCGTKNSTRGIIAGNSVIVIW